jgi:hypothetical protein
VRSGPEHGEDLVLGGVLVHPRRLSHGLSWMDG